MQQCRNALGRAHATQPTDGLRLRLAAPSQPLRIPSRTRSVIATAAVRNISVEDGKRLLDQDGYLFLDVRSAKEYDDEHLTKPPRCTVNVPITLKGKLDEVDPDFVSKVKLSKSAKLLLADKDGGKLSETAAELLQAAGFAEVLRVEGGYSAWRSKFTTCGRQRIEGKWMPTGKEALKSGLPIPGVADRYEDINPV